jgi:hypothetical protein
MEDMKKQIQDNMMTAQENQRHFSKRTYATYKEGDWVLVARDRVTGGPALKTPKAKWQHLFRGPFQVTKQINDNAYQLQMPTWFQGHPVFNIGHLRRWTGVPPSALPDEELHEPDMQAEEPVNLQEATIRRSTRVPKLADWVAASGLNLGGGGVQRSTSHANDQVANSNDHLSGGTQG